MANEIGITTQLNWARGGASIVAKVSGKEDQIGTTAIENVQVIGAASEIISLGDVTDPSHLFFKNETKPWSLLTNAEKLPFVTQANYDAANTVNLGTTSPVTAGNATIRLKPQQGQPLINPLAAWYGINSGTDIDLLVVAIQR